MKVRDEDSRAVVVIASDQRERGNLIVFEGTKNGEIAPKVSRVTRPLWRQG